MRVSLLWTAPLLLVTAQASAQTRDLNDLVGASAAGAEQEMLRRDYVSTGREQDANVCNGSKAVANEGLLIGVAKAKASQLSLSVTSRSRGLHPGS